MLDGVIKVMSQNIDQSKDQEHTDKDQESQIGDDGACPYFWPISDRHILLFFSHMSGGQYIIGSYNEDKQKFYAEKPMTHSLGTYNKTYCRKSDHKQGR